MGCCLLLVEDEHEIREQLRELLEDEGYEVVEAQNGREALTKLEDGLVPAMVLMDLMMPIMDGWQLLASMRQSQSLCRLPVMISSAVCDKAALPKDVPFIVKPYSVAKLLMAVHAQIR